MNSSTNNIQTVNPKCKKCKGLGIIYSRGPAYMNGMLCNCRKIIMVSSENPKVEYVLERKNDDGEWKKSVVFPSNMLSEAIGYVESLRKAYKTREGYKLFEVITTTTKTEI